MINVEAIVVGGGPAGSTCAKNLKKGGIDTIILDKNEFPRTKLCAGWITPKVIKHLQIDLNDYPGSLIEFNRLHFRFYGKNLPIRTHQYSIRRYEFDSWLLQRSGVPVQNFKVKEIIKDGSNYVIDGKYRCKYLIGAGGTNCPVYRQLFSGGNPRNKELRVTAMEQEFIYDYQDNNCYLWFFDNGLPGYSWYVPKGNGIINVGIGAKLNVLKAKGEIIRYHWDYFIKKLKKTKLIKDYDFKPQGYNYYIREKNITPRIGNAFVVGDAAGVATKDMGEGIGPSVESGILAAKSLINNTNYSLKNITKYSFVNIFLN